jgi:hypothetical protein
MNSIVSELPHRVGNEIDRNNLKPVRVSKQNNRGEEYDAPRKSAHRYADLAA